MHLPEPRGEVSARLLDALTSSATALLSIPDTEFADRFGDEDLHLSLYLCYELHYRGLPGVDEHWEWQPSLLAARARLEHCFEQGLREGTGHFVVVCGRRIAVASMAAPPERSCWPCQEARAC